MLSDSPVWQIWVVLHSPSLQIFHRCDRGEQLVRTQPVPTAFAPQWADFSLHSLTSLVLLITFPLGGWGGSNMNGLNCTWQLCSPGDEQVSYLPEPKCLSNHSKIQNELSPKAISWTNTAPPNAYTDRIRIHINMACYCMLIVLCFCVCLWLTVLWHIRWLISNIVILVVSLKKLVYKTNTGL